MSRVLQWVAYVTLLSAFALSLFIGFNLLYPYPTMTVENPAKILNTDRTVKPGETLLVQIDCEKFTDKPGVVTRMFINDIVYVLPDYVSNYPVGKRNTTSYSTKVPKDLPNGTYYVRTTIQYEFPPFRKVAYTFDTEEFCVCGVADAPR